MSERLGGFGRGEARVWDDGAETWYDREQAQMNGQDEWADELNAEIEDDQRRMDILHRGFR